MYPRVHKYSPISDRKKENVVAQQENTAREIKNFLQKKECHWFAKKISNGIISNTRDVWKCEYSNGNQAKVF